MLQTFRGIRRAADAPSIDTARATGSSRSVA